MKYSAGPFKKSRLPNNYVHIDPFASFLHL